MPSVSVQHIQQKKGAATLPEARITLSAVRIFIFTLMLL